jgi:DNA polymerase-3 subunit delta'
MLQISEYKTDILPWFQTQYDQIRQQQESGRLPHAFLLGGDRFQGKTSFALAIAAFVLCRNNQSGKACGECKSCKLRIAGSHPDLYKLEPGKYKSSTHQDLYSSTKKDNSSYILVDEIRELVSWSAKTSQQGGCKVVIIKPAEAMNLAAANALLKCLEEPVANTLILLISDRPGRLLATIRSRCQHIQILNPSGQEALAYLESLLPDHGDLNSLLSLAQSRPLKALEIDRTDLLTHYQALNRAMTDLFQNRVLAHEAAASLADSELEMVLETLLYWLGEVLKSVHCSETKGNINKEIGDISNLIYNKMKPAGFFRFYDFVSAQRSALSGSSNPNKQLILESVMVEFSHGLT